MLYIIAYPYRINNNDMLIDQSQNFFMVYLCLNLQIKNFIVLINRYNFLKIILFDISNIINLMKS